MDVPTRSWMSNDGWLVDALMSTTFWRGYTCAGPAFACDVAARWPSEH